MLKACIKQKEFFYTFNLIKDFELTLENKIPPANDIIPTIYPCQRMKDYLKQDLDAGRVINDYITNDEVMQLLTKYNYRCIYCHIGSNYRSWSLDKIDNNIQHTYNNCVISCVNCNVTRKKYVIQTILWIRSIEKI